MISIHFRKNKDSTWTCYGTVQEIDYSFSSISKSQSKFHMTQLLLSKKIPLDTVKWFENENAK